MKARLLISLLLAVAVCFYACESTSLDEQLDDSSTTVPSEEEQNPDDGAGKTDPNSGGDDDNEVVELPPLPDLEDVDDVCTKMTDLDFMRYCYENFDVNGDAKVSMYEANAVKIISCSTAEDFTGIEYFPNLESFESYSAKILDLRYNTQLSNINFYVKVSSGHYKSAPIEELDLRYCSNLTEIGEDTFYNCTELTSVELPYSLTSIGSYAFYCCTSLTSIGLPTGLTSIGGAAFRDCSELTSIDLPDSLTSIDSQAFDCCKKLKTVTSRAVTPPSAYASSSWSYDDTFYGCSFALYVPAESVSEYKSAYGWSHYATSIEAISE